MCRLEGMEYLEADMELLGAVKLGEVGDEELWVLEGGRDALEVQKLGHLDLLVQPAADVLAEARHVANGECVGPLDGHLARLAAVERRHALDLGEGHIVSILQPVARLVEGRDEAFLINPGHDAVERVLARRVDDCELFDKIAKDGAEEAERVGDDDVDALGVAVIADGDLVVEGCVCEDDDLVFVELLEVVAQAVTRALSALGLSARAGVAAYTYLLELWMWTGV
jgi:hypothetical protein